MIDPSDELKIRAEILHKRITAGDPGSCTRLRALVELAKADDERLAAAVGAVQRKHCLAVVAREVGFTSWAHALEVLRGDAAHSDFGTLLYDAEACRGMLNAWFSEHYQARAHLVARRERGEKVFLLPYKRQFVVVDSDFIEALGFDADESDWTLLDHDWLSPELAARQRLYAKRLAAMGRRS
jgi:hypothetical protein